MTVKREVKNDNKIKLKGKLSMGVPFLSKTALGNYYVPAFYYSSSTSSILNEENNVNTVFYTLRSGKEEIIYQDFNLDIFKSEYKKLSLLVIDEQTKKYKWYVLDVWGEVAKDIHLNYKKNDLVYIEGKTIQRNNKEVVFVQNIKLLSR